MSTTVARRAPLTPRSRAALETFLEAGKVRSAEHPHLPPAEAPLTTPEKRVYLRVTENDVHRNGEGGRVVLQGLAGREDPRLIGATLTLVYAHDEPMWDLPAFREDMEGAVYELVLREITRDQVPADPTPPSAEDRIRQLEREKAALERRLAGNAAVSESGA